MDEEYIDFINRRVKEKEEENNQVRLEVNDALFGSGKNKALVIISTMICLTIDILLIFACIHFGFLTGLSFFIGTCFLKSMLKKTKSKYFRYI